MTTTPALTVEIEAFLDILSSTLGAGFQLWCDEDVDEATTPVVATARQNGFGTFAINDEMSRIWIALPGQGHAGMLATATLSARDPELLQRLAQAARQLLEQHQTIVDQTVDANSFLETLTSGFEEQTWLRSLSSHLALCSIERNIGDVARELLPSLRTLVRADSVTLILTGATELNPPHVDARVGRTMETVCDGPLQLEDAVWRHWLIGRTVTVPPLPLVQNHAHVDELLQQCGIDSFCAVPLVHADVCYGWLAAAKAQRVPPATISEMDFGTIEAGLIEAAASMLATHEHNLDLLKDRENLTVGVIRSMGNAVDARDPYTRGHSERVGRYGRLLAQAIGLPAAECDRIYLSGLLHDVGKIGVPDAVLGKQGKLTDEEFALIKRHPEIGAWIIQSMPQLADLLPGILHHHESIDGTGYPCGLVGDAIPLMGRILAVADAYDAMTSNRPYRPGMPRSRACSILSENAGIQWDKPLVEAFLKIPETDLLLDAIETDKGWVTDETFIRGGTAALLNHRTPLNGTSTVVDDALPARVQSATLEAS